MCIMETPETSNKVSGKGKEQWKSKNKLLFGIGLKYKGSTDNNAKQTDELKKRDTQDRLPKIQTPVSCPTCNKVFSCKKNLNKHELLHKTDYSFKYVCDKCDKKYLSEGDLIVHIRSHTGEKPFACDQCERKYPSASSLTRHKLCHAEKTLLCNECGKGFYSKAILMKHMQSHTVERNFKCDQCRYRFKRSIDLQRHKLCHKHIERMACPLPNCPRQFRRKDNLIRHLRLTHDLSKDEANRTYTTGFSGNQFQTATKNSSGQSEITSETEVTEEPTIEESYTISSPDAIGNISTPSLTPFGAEITDTQTTAQMVQSGFSNECSFKAPQIPCMEEASEEVTHLRPVGRTSVAASVIRLADSSVADCRKDDFNSLQGHIQQINSAAVSDCIANLPVAHEMLHYSPQLQLSSTPTPTQSYDWEGELVPEKISVNPYNPIYSTYDNIPNEPHGIETCADSPKLFQQPCVADPNVVYVDFSKFPDSQTENCLTQPTNVIGPSWEIIAEPQQVNTNAVGVIRRASLIARDMVQIEHASPTQCGAVLRRIVAFPETQSSSQHQKTSCPVEDYHCRTGVPYQTRDPRKNFLWEKNRSHIHGDET